MAILLQEPPLAGPGPAAAPWESGGRHNAGLRVAHGGSVTTQGFHRFHNGHCVNCVVAYHDVLATSTDLHVVRPRWKMKTTHMNRGERKDSHWMVRGAH